MPKASTLRDTIRRQAGPTPINQALMALESEFPGAAQVPVRRMSLWERMLNRHWRDDPGVASAGTLGRSINIDPQQVAPDLPQGELEDLLSHELVHLRQRKQHGLARYLFEQKIRPWIEPDYLKRPFEREALDYEVNRSLRPHRPALRGDIRLR